MNVNAFRTLLGNRESQAGSASGKTIRRNAKRRCALVGCFLIAMASGLAASGPDSKAPAGRDFNDFKIILDRNIFNARRSGGSTARTADGEKPPREDRITLVGTLSYEKGPYAFFDGSSPEFRKVAEKGKSIAGYTITAIDADAVQMTAGTNSITLRVGMELRREEEGEWHLSNGSFVQSTSPSSPSPADSASNDDDALVKKLMQQREQELK